MNCSAIKLTVDMRGVPQRLIRFALALGVSLWMAGGGCMFGCAGQANAAVKPVEVAPAAHHSMAGQSCHAHKKASSKAATHQQKLLESLSLPVANTSDSPRECPLAANATTAGAKSSGSIVQRALTVVEVLPQVEPRRVSLEHYSARLHVPNRGPTYLRCCVFLI